MFERLLACLLCIALLASQLQADDSQNREQNQFSQTQSGVTAKIEKIAIERIIDADAWLRDRLPARQDGTSAYPKSFRIVKVFISTIGPVDHYATVLDNMNCEFGEPRAGRIIHGRGLYDPKDWRAQLSDLDVDRGAHGVLHWVLLEDDTNVEQLFPIRATTRLRAQDGKKLTFELTALAP